MWIKDAFCIAHRLVEEMRPHCERVEIGGSIRRGCQEVKDIEIIVVPRRQPGEVIDLFGTTEEVNLLHSWALDAEARKELRWIKPNTSEVIPWPTKPEGKYWRGLVRETVKLDLFIARPDNFGLIYLIRTGHRDFSAAVLGHAKRNTRYQTESSYFDEHEIKNRGDAEGYLVEKARWGRRVETREESDVFELLELEFVEPRARVGYESLKMKRVAAPVVATAL
ncbi:MAG: hypothetical protein H0T60_19225 [Acidobacteria bacterium]|nr:hypothetical protein [Acidobacteriota bacterium]